MNIPKTAGNAEQGTLIDATRVRREFGETYGRPPTAVGRAPGRVNLIGEHTDYNDGFVLPMALQQCTWAAAAPRPDRTVRVRSTQVGAEHSWVLEGWNWATAPHWTSYIAGVTELLRQRQDSANTARPRNDRGFDLLVCSDVPVGGGLSSSAALEVAVGLVLSYLMGQRPSPVELADLCRRAEHEYARVPCGIMDQYISVLGKAGTALLLDCRSRTYEHIPLPLKQHVVVMVNTGVHHELASGEYAKRQEQCRAAVEYFRRLNPAWSSLRAVPVAAVLEHRLRLDPVVAARALHVCTEIERTEAAADALRRGDLARMGVLMADSHRSLRDDYQVSCTELDRLVEIVAAVPGVLGARMTGGGFGGCIVAIAQNNALDGIATAVRDGYDAVGPARSQLLVSAPGAGAGIEFTDA